MIRTFAVFCACLLLTACGGGGGSSGTSATTTTSTTTASTSSTSSTTTSGSTTGATTTTTTAPTLTNFATVTVDAGPAVLNTGSNPYTTSNSPFVSVTLCAPGSTTNCQTIDHVLLDTGSVGLRIYASVLNSTLLAALTNQTDASSNPVGECYGFVEGYLFGSVRQADFKVGGEAVSGLALQVIGDTGRYAAIPSTCSSQGGTNLNTVQSFGANGVLGVGVTVTDCGSQCTATGGSGAAIYYDCPATACSSIIGRTSTTTAPFQQLPNPVAVMSVDNNGTILSLPAPGASGSATLTGTVYFGIGTQTNNALGSATILTTSGSSSAIGAGLITATYNSKALTHSFLDSGTNLYIFVDNAITACTGSAFTGYYCPATPLALTPTLTGANGVTVSAAFTLNNAKTLVASNFAALPGIGGNPSLFDGLSTVTNSFDFGLPFFYGRNVFTAIEGRNAGGTSGPYFAF